MAESLQQEIDRYETRLKEIEERIARAGARVDPDLIKQREDLRTRLSRLRDRQAVPTEAPASRFGSGVGAFEAEDVTRGAAINYSADSEVRVQDQAYVQEKVAAGDIFSSAGQAVESSAVFSAPDKLVQPVSPTRPPTDQMSPEQQKPGEQAEDIRLRRLSPSARQAVGMGMVLARDAQQPALTSDTLLIALYEKTDGPTRAVLAAFGFPPDHFFGWLEKHQGRQMSAELLEAAATSADTVLRTAYPLGEDVGRILQSAERLADERRSAVVRTRHLLLALLTVGLSEPDPGLQPAGYQWLQVMGIPVEAVRNILAQAPETAQIVSSMFAYAASSAFADIATEQDQLGFELSAQALAEIIVKPETIPPVVIGVYGPWGSGKSTFMALVRKHLTAWDKRQHPDQALPGWRRALKRLAGRINGTGPAEEQPRIVCVEFNAWAYTDAEKLWAGLVEKISPHLDEQIPWWRKPLFWLSRNFWRFLGATLLGVLPIAAGLLVIYSLAVWDQFQRLEWATQAIAWLAALGASLAGSIKVFALQKPLTEVVSSLVNRYDPTEVEGVMSRIQEEFNQTVKDYFLLSAEEPSAAEGVAVPPQPDAVRLRQKKLKAVVMIDELDRCPLEKIVDILEAIKIFLAEEIFIVLMAVDTRVVAEAIRLHYKDVKNPYLAREYLEKIIQIPVQVPGADRQQLTKYVSSLMSVAEGEADSDEATGLRGPALEPSRPAQPETRLERSRLAVSEDLFNPLRLSDTSAERTAITDFAFTFLESNPRRIKRLLNTYRYVKILATRQGERTDLAEWQVKTVNWLAFTMRWPTFMERAIRRGRLPSATEEGQELLRQLCTDLPDNQRPPVEAFRLSLPGDDEIARYEFLANNFIVESPPSVVAPAPADEIHERNARSLAGEDE